MSVALVGTNNLTIELDEDGYLRHLHDWTPIVAQQLAAQQQLTLNEEHWADKASSIYVMSLFGDGTPAKTVARIAGLPKPTNCI